MAKETIEFTIDAQGNVHAEAHGFKGRGCAAEIGKLIAKLGRVASEKRKGDYYQGEQAETRKAGR